MRTHTASSLRNDFEKLGISAADHRPLVVHSALRKVGKVEGGADAVIESLLAALGSRGTLLFPNLNIPHAFTADRPPRFDLRRDPIRQQLGILPQRFKESFATHFSRHTTHAMMGRGPACEELFIDHELANYCCGPGTPWWRLAQAEGQILLLGATQQNNTSIHGPEELFTTYQLSRDAIEGIIVDGDQSLSVRSRLHLWGNDSEFARINPYLEARGGIRSGVVGDALAYLIDAKIFQEEVSARLQESPTFLLKVTLKTV